MECELDYSILTDVTREIVAVMREYNVRREIEDEDVSEEEFSTEDDSDGETSNDDSDFEFDLIDLCIWFQGEFLVETHFQLSLILSMFL